MVDMVALASECSFNGQRLHIDVCLHQSSQVWRESADMGRLDSIPINKAGDLDSAPFGKIADDAGIGHIAVDDARCIRLHTVDDA